MNNKVLPPPPTYADPVVIDRNKKPGDLGFSKFDPIWLKYFIDLGNTVNNIPPLGAAAAGANSDITSLSGLTTPLNVHQGGTGNTLFSAGGVLFGNGTGAIQVAASNLFWDNTNKGLAIGLGALLFAADKLSASTQMSFGATAAASGTIKHDGSTFLITNNKSGGSVNIIPGSSGANGSTVLFASDNLTKVISIGGNAFGLGFFGITPIAQPTTASASAAFVANAGTAINTLSTFDGYTLDKVVKALRNYGLLA
jgi:hypothetical protein